MTDSAGVLDGTGLAVVLAYLCSLLLIGWYANRRSLDTTAGDYYLAGSSLGFTSLFFTLYATQYSGNTLLALPGKSYRNGFEGLAIVAAVMSIVLVYTLFAPRLNRLAREHRFITVADFLRWRYRCPPLVTAVNLVLLITLVSYALGNFKAIGLLLESASGGAIGFAWAVLLLAVIMGIYESLGGMRGVVWTDVLQGVLLLGGCLLIFLAVAASSPEDSVTRPAGMARELAAFFGGGIDWLEFISLVLVVAFGAAVYPQAIQRIYAARDDRTLKKSYRLMFFMPLVTTLPMLLVGMSVAEWRPGLDSTRSEQVVILAIGRVVEYAPALAGLLVLCLAAALAAIMSTIDSALLSLGSIVTTDWMGERGSRRAGRIASWALMLLMALLAIYLPHTIWGADGIQVRIAGAGGTGHHPGGALAETVRAGRPVGPGRRIFPGDRQPALARPAPGGLRRRSRGAVEPGGAGDAFCPQATHPRCPRRRAVMAMRTLLLLLLGLLSSSTWACSSEELFGQMAQRLSLMPAVAHYKRARGLPIEDLERERRVLAASVQQAAELGLPAAVVEPFVQAQMDAAKALQRRQQTPGAELDSIRRQLMDLTAGQLRTLSCLREAGWEASEAERPAFERALAGSGLTPEERARLFRDGLLSP